MTKRRTFRVNADSWTVLQDLLVATPEDFNSDSDTLRGRTIDYDKPSHIPSMGELPAEYSIALRNGLANHRVEFVIYSYRTPIAWRERTVSPNRVKGSNGHTVGYSNHRWVMPDVRYSVTTSKHQGKVRTALSQISGGI